jgi:tetratricopeptide (TPR) repeat protein
MIIPNRERTHSFSDASSKRERTRTFSDSSSTMASPVSPTRKQVDTVHLRERTHSTSDASSMQGSPASPTRKQVDTVPLRERTHSTSDASLMLVSPASLTRKQIDTVPLRERAHSANSMLISPASATRKQVSLGPNSGAPPPALSASWAPSPSPPPSPLVRTRSMNSPLMSSHRLVDPFPLKETNRTRTFSDNSSNRMRTFSDNSSTLGSPVSTAPKQLVDTIPLQETNRSRRVSDDSSTLGSVSTTRKMTTDPDSDGLKSLEKALKWHLRHSESDRDSQIAALYNRIGNIHFRRRDFRKAVKFYSHAVKCNAAVEHVAAAFSNLGTVYWTSGDVGNALQMLEQALETYELHNIQQGRAPGESLEIAGVYHQMGLVFALQREFERAVHSLKTAWGIRERLTGARSILTARTVDALGKVYTMMRDLKTALQYHERALDIFNANGVNAAGVLENMLTVHTMRGDDVAALYLYSQVLLHKRMDFAKSLSHEAGLVVANTLHSMSGLCQRAGRDQEAALYHREASAIFHQAGLTTE